VCRPGEKIVHPYFSQNDKGDDRTFYQQVVDTGKRFWTTVFDISKKSARAAVFSVGVVTFPLWWTLVYWYNKRQAEKHSNCSGENTDDGKTERGKAGTEVHF
jgi:hypothetical protein